MSFNEVLDLGMHRALMSDFSSLLTRGYGYETLVTQSIAQCLLRDVRTTASWASANPGAPSDAIQERLEGMFDSSLRSFSAPINVAVSPSNKALLIDDLLGCVGRASRRILDARTNRS